MRRPKKSLTRPTNQEEARRTNVLLKSLDNTLRVVAEDVGALRSESGSMKLAIEDIDKRLGRLEPIVQTLAKDVAANTRAIETLNKTVEGHTKTLESHTKAIEANTKAIERLEKKVDAIDQRLSAAETRFPASS